LIQHRGDGLGDESRAVAHGDDDARFRLHRAAVLPVLCLL
jgi:hypothetical protein